MTSPKFDIKIEKKLKNFGHLSLMVLKQLLEEKDEDITIYDDAKFVQKVLDFINDEDNIWKAKNGIYVKKDAESDVKRIERIYQLSIALNMPETTVKEIITRIMNALKRSELRGDGIAHIFKLTHGGVSLEKLLNEES